MEIIQLVFAILLSWVLGTVWLQQGRSILPGPGYWLMSLGYGYILGTCATTLIMRLLETLGLSQNVNIIASLVALFAIAGVWLLPRNSPILFRNSQSSSTQILPLWQKVTFIFFLLLIILRFFNMGFEVILRPLFPWDAWTTWSVKPHVWFAYKQLVPFVDAEKWLSNKQSFDYTIVAWHYPNIVPLIQLWTALAYGQWNETINNISWFLCAVALVLGFYGQARQYGIDPLRSIIFTYFLISIPLLNTHVALAGYADLWMATIFSFAAIAFWQWLKTKNPQQGLIAIGLGMMLPFIKNEGIVWLLTVIPALIVYISSKTILFVLSFFVVALALIFFFIGSIYLELPGLGELSLTSNFINIPHLGSFELISKADFSVFTDNLLLFDNWHLFWFLVPVIVFFSLPSIFSNKLLFIYTVMIFTGIGILVMAFSMTGAKEWAESKTSINRVFLHMVPLLSFYMLILFQSAFGKRFGTTQSSVLRPV
jgi:hypothetical protein